jgi:hypothetical protein
MILRLLLLLCGLSTVLGQVQQMVRIWQLEVASGHVG